MDHTLEEDANTLGSLLMRLSWLGRRRLEQELTTYNLTVPQYVALRCIRDRAEGCSMSQLAEASEQVPATMTGVIDRLAERQLVRRERDSNDRRAQRVLLTPAGQELLDRVTESKRAWVREFAGTFSAEERKVMIKLAQRYLAAIENAVTTA